MVKTKNAAVSAAFFSPAISENKNAAIASGILVVADRRPA
jgi:hypothetical protein